MEKVCINASYNIVVTRLQRQASLLKHDFAFKNGSSLKSFVTTKSMLQDCD